MTKVTSKEIAQLRSQLVDDSQAMEVLDLIEDCEGDLEDAAMTLAIRAGQEPGQTNADWLDGLAKKWRVVLCQREYRGELLNGSIVEMMAKLQELPDFPKILATPILIYVLKQGIDNFCQPLDVLN
ncbi:hypothetical protein VB711_08310 [Cronbergia sp. UHCC 0137]|uniref:hypothetical protein n=1 Tax=Cronbergia sp. UHCC 0137 TaxID=3110239 RepID=UPI002B1F2137|nr:hypothetical protein [Cronbergia sp. UHCC 0137]MEA5617840.1 hypothetical protein [Cronbergia sp. UHCC 0137]